LLARARLPRNHHGEIGLHQSSQHAIDFLHCRRAADQGNGVEVIRFRGRSRPFFRLGQRPADDPDELLEIERLGQIFVGATLGGAHGGHKRVLRAHDDDGKRRPQLFDARQEVEGVLVRHHHVGDDEVALPLADPAPQRCGVAGRADFVTCTRQRLVEHGADRRVVVRDQKVSRWHWHPLQAASPGSASLPRNMGMSTRKMVRRGCDSHSMIPPWSPIIFDTSAKPRPDPVDFVVTNGSNRWGNRSSGTPGPLSLTQNSSGSETRVLLPGSDSRTPGRKAVDSWISPSGALSPIASAAFFTRLRNTWTSWSRLASTGGSEGSYSSTNLMWRAKPDCASRFT